MSGLIARRGRQQGVWLLGGRKGFVADSLAVWAHSLNKDSRTVRRYAESGDIPNAYCTPGGHWRAPFTEEALAIVKKQMLGRSRTRTSSDWAKDWPTHNESEARIYTAAYALFLAVERERLESEAQIIHFYQDILFSQQGKWLKKKVEKSPCWLKCLTMAKKHGWKNTALIGAYAHAVVEVLAESKDEARANFDRGRFRPFGRIPSGEIALSPKRVKRKRSPVSGASLRLRAQVVSRAKNPVGIKSVMQKWQWIIGQRHPKNAETHIKVGYPKHSNRAYVQQESRFYARRTFYNWYRHADRKWALSEMRKLLFS